MSGRMNFKTRLAGGAAVAAILLGAGAAQAAEPVKFDIAPQPLTAALNEFGVQSNHAVLFTTDLTNAKITRGVSKEADPEIALAEMLNGTGLSFRRSGDAFLIVSASDPQSGSAAGDGADSGTVQALIVTAQKREEDIQDVPIAISAFTQENLERSQIAGGPDLMTQVPNMTFTKTNFSSYSIQIRGIGTQAISATTDPAVAVAFNNTPFVENRFFEQEFYDLQRVEVLRGPQGTLYGRNATGGVVNLISAKPKFNFEAKASGDLANYNTTRIEGMVNIPLVEDMVALRIAGAWTKRDGYATNQITGNQIDGRDLWSTRVSLRFTPNDRIDANLIWEHFQEDDDRIRSGKQLCKTDEVTSVAGFTVPDHFYRAPTLNQTLLFAGVQGTLSQGCAPSSLYSPDSFQTVNGLSLAYYTVLQAIGLPTALDDPYFSRTQSQDLRVIESTVDPHYSADSDVAELQFSIDITDNLTLSSETGWAHNSVFSTQDYNRFNTKQGAWRGPDPFDIFARENLLRLNDQGFWEFYDPQIGWADRLVAVDLSTGESTQFSQEFRLASDYDGPFNFSLGANFLRFDFEAKYYVFINSLSMLSALYSAEEGPYVPGVSDGSGCLVYGPRLPDPLGIEVVAHCTYMDPNPIGSLNDLGHNHFLSKNPYKLISYAMFGEAYYNITDNLKVTAGIRWTVDKKEAPRIPSWLLAANTLGYPVADVVRQEWREPTGRLAIDWKPDLSFTDETLLYASYAHGYKAGGANPPAAGLTIYGASVEERNLLRRDSVTKPRTFDPEFVNAFELGAKNTLADGKVTLNLAAFYYDYKDYQISYITDRSAVNLNFDATVWGLELESDWRPLENLRLGLKLGYENTRVADGEKAIDVMNRTAGDPRYTLAKPFPTYSNNCVIPTWLLVGNADTGTQSGGNPGLVVPTRVGGGANGPCEEAYLLGHDPVTALDYVANPAPPSVYQGVNYTAWSTDPNDYPGAVWPGGVVTNGNYPGWNPLTDPNVNGGEGLFTDLSGNELPNAPHYTATVTADYTVPLPNDWLATLHTDFYYQSEAWTRIWNLEGYDKLKAYTNVNLAAIFTNEDAGWKVMAYVKNAFDRDSITGSFLNSDDSGLTTNVFLTEPRLYGLRVSKTWTGGPLLGAFGSRHEGPYPFTVELGGMIQRVDAPNEQVRPSFADAFSPEIDPFAAQDNDLDWGDGRSVKLTYAAQSGWKTSLAAQWGKANGGSHDIKSAQEAVKGCAFIACPPGSPSDYFVYLHDASNGNTHEREEHTVVDFIVGRDVGLGVLDASTVSAGLQYAQFKSTTSVDAYGIPDWNVVQSYYGKYYGVHHRYGANFKANREFKGTGPVVSWDASIRLLGNEDSGRVDIDWSLSGGVLFGKQKTTTTGNVQAAYYYSGLYSNSYATPTCPIIHTNDCPTSTTPLNIPPRSKSVTVPTFGAELGLSYKVDRFKVGAGYRWERYYDVIDGGVSEHKSYDRTLDGPYLKVSVGFGG